MENLFAGISKIGAGLGGVVGAYSFATSWGSLTSIGGVFSGAAGFIIGGILGSFVGAIALTLAVAIIAFLVGIAIGIIQNICEGVAMICCLA